MNYDNMIKELTDTGKYKVLKKLIPKISYNRLEKGTPLNVGCLVDVETTGLDKNTDEILSLCIMYFQYDTTGKLYNVAAPKFFLNEPTIEISKRAGKINGLTLEELKGKKLDVNEIEKILRPAAIIVAHNAAFDRGFIDKVIPISRNKIWCDSFKQIPWDHIKDGDHKLSSIASFYNFFYDEHDAISDCYAAIEILSRSHNDKTNLSYLLDSLNENYSVIKAVNSPFKSKELLKDNDYSWAGEIKTWYKIVKTENVDAEIEFLKHNIYQYDCAATVTNVNRVDLFKEV